MQPQQQLAMPLESRPQRKTMRSSRRNTRSGGSDHCDAASAERSKDSWCNDSDHYDLAQDERWKELKDDPSAKEKRREFKRKFLKDRQDGRDRERLKKFIDTQQVGVCVNNPHLMGKSGFGLLEKINKYDLKSAQKLLKQSMNTNIHRKISFSSRVEHFKRISNQISQPGPHEYHQVCRNLDHQRSVFQEQMSHMERMQKESLVQRIQEKLLDRRQQMKDQKSCRVKAKFQGHEIFRQMIMQQSEYQNNQKQNAQTGDDFQGVQPRRSSLHHPNDMEREKDKILRLQRKFSIGGKSSGNAPEARVTRKNNLTIKISKLLECNKQDDSSLTAQLHQNSPSAEYENSSSVDSEDQDAENIAHPKSPLYKVAMKRQLFKRQLGNLPTLDQLHHSVYQTKDGSNQNANRHAQDPGESVFSSIKLQKAGKHGAEAKKLSPGSRQQSSLLSSKFKQRAKSVHQLSGFDNTKTKAALQNTLQVVQQLDSLQKNNPSAQNLTVEQAKKTFETIENKVNQNAYLSRSRAQINRIYKTMSVPQSPSDFYSGQQCQFALSKQKPVNRQIHQLALNIQLKSQSSELKSITKDVKRQFHNISKKSSQPSIQNDFARSNSKILGTGNSNQVFRDQQMCQNLLDLSRKQLTAAQMSLQYMQPHPEFLKKHYEDKEKRTSQSLQMELEISVAQSQTRSKTPGLGQQRSRPSESNQIDVETSQNHDSTSQLYSNTYKGASTIQRNDVRNIFSNMSFRGTIASTATRPKTSHTQGQRGRFRKGPGIRDLTKGGFSEAAFKQTTSKVKGDGDAIVIGSHSKDPRVLRNQLDNFSQQLNNKEAFVRFWSMKCKQLQNEDRMISFFKVSHYKPPYESKHTNANTLNCVQHRMKAAEYDPQLQIQCKQPKYSYSQVFEARYGSQAVQTVPRNQSPRNAMSEIYIHGGIGHQLFENVYRYDQMHGDFDVIAPVKNAQQSVVKVGQGGGPAPKVIKNRVDHTNVVWREYLGEEGRSGSNAPRHPSFSPRKSVRRQFRDVIVMFGGQENQGYRDGDYVSQKPEGAPMDWIEQESEESEEEGEVAAAGQSMGFKNNPFKKVPFILTPAKTISTNSVDPKLRNLGSEKRRVTFSQDVSVTDLGKCDGATPDQEPSSRLREYPEGRGKGLMRVEEEGADTEKQSFNFRGRGEDFLSLAAESMVPFQKPDELIQQQPRIITSQHASPSSIINVQPSFKFSFDVSKEKMEQEKQKVQQDIQNKKKQQQREKKKVQARTLRNCIAEICLLDIERGAYDCLDFTEIKQKHLNSKQGADRASLLYFPAPRRNHVACILNDHMVIYGGLDDWQQPMNDIASLDLRRKVWTPINRLQALMSEPYVSSGVRLKKQDGVVIKQPLSQARVDIKQNYGQSHQIPHIYRAKACLVIHEQRLQQQIKSITDIPDIDWRKAEEMILYEGIYIFGGIQKRFKDIQAEVSSKMYILAILPKKNEKKNNCLQFKCLDEMEPKPTGKPPSGRYDHALVKIKNYLVVFGGRVLSTKKTSNFKKMFDDTIFLLQLDTLVWTQLKTLSPIQKSIAPIHLFRSEFMFATIPSSLAPLPSSDQYQYLSKQEQADIDYGKYRHSEKVLIFGGIDENNRVSNQVLQLEFFQNKLLSKFREKMSSLVSMKYVQMQQQKNERREMSPERRGGDSPER